MTIPQIIAEIQFTAGVWTDVSQWLLHNVSVQRGSSRVESPVIRYEPGKATIRLDNRDRRFDPTNLSGPYVVGGASRVTSMRPIRLQATWDGDTYPLFRGFVDEFIISWVAQVHSEVTVPATDGFKVLDNIRRQPVYTTINGEQVATVFGTGELSGARVSRILDSAGWPIGDRSIATGNSQMSGTILEGSALKELQDVAETELGELYINASGAVFFRNRHAIITESRSNTSQWTLGGTTGLSPIVVTLTSDDSTLWNQVAVSRVGGTPQVAEDTVSQAEFMTRTFERNGLLLTNDSEALNWAEWIVSLTSTPELRFATVTVFPLANPSSLFPHVLTREIGDRVTIVVHPPGGGSAISRDMFIRGVSHEVSQENWQTTYVLQSATNFGAFFELGHASNGLLNNDIPLVY